MTTYRNTMRNEDVKIRDMSARDYEQIAKTFNETPVDFNRKKTVEDNIYEAGVREGKREVCRWLRTQLGVVGVRVE